MLSAQPPYSRKLLPFLPDVHYDEENAYMLHVTRYMQI